MGMYNESENGHGARVILRAQPTHTHVQTQQPPAIKS
jgi:hypothetical protein